ncbi:DUF6519 domain-containing protein [Chitinimonas sp.]|uniref:DUF6519 domain-containing protein n=1 Tax=Chitinimonas sp. TaxID=1934313 RepID=UPI002F9595B8
MKGDFTRNTFDPQHHFSRVLMQQGRVTLDADYNEQAAILLHYLRTLAKDLIGPFGIPVSAEGGFALTPSENGQDIKISRGRCYVDGFLVENDAEAPSWRQQPYLDVSKSDPDGLGAFLTGNGNPDRTFLLYLDVWERHVTAIEAPNTREVALGGPDTCSRSQVVWQLKAEAYTTNPAPVNGEGALKLCTGEYARLTNAEVNRRAGATLTADLDPVAGPVNACITAPESRYRGLENQLYRVEIHDGSANGVFTFKWSRDNGSVAAGVVGLAQGGFEVTDSRGFETGDWVEMTFDEHDLLGKPGWVFQLAGVDGNTLLAAADTLPNGIPGTWQSSFALTHPKIRRWNQTANEQQALTGGVIQVSTATLNANPWVAIEDGLRVAFAPLGDYRCGDYWLIPARVATGEIEWPRAREETGALNPQPLPPEGILHHYAPLAFVKRGAGQPLTVWQCSCRLEPISHCEGIQVG